MRKLYPYLLYPTAGLLAGWASIVVIPPGHEERKRAAEDGGPAVSSRMREARSTPPPMSPARLLEETRRLLAASQDQGTATGRAIAGWTNEEILAALDEAAREPDTLLRYSNTTTSLLQEFAERDPEAAMRWAMEQPAILRGRFASIVLHGWLPDRVAEAYAFAREHRDLFGGKMPAALVTASIQSASAEGSPAFIARLRELMADGGNRYMEAPAGLAADLDFAELLESPDFTGLNLTRMKQSLVRTWGDRDREAAFRWLLEHEGPGALASLRKEAWSTTYAQAADQIRWMVGKVETLTPEQQAEFIRMNGDKLRQQDGYATTWIEAAKTPEMRDALRTAAAGAVFSNQVPYVERGLQALATLPDAEARLSALEGLESGRSPFDREVTPGVDKLLREKLAEWGAEPPRVEAILRKLHGGPGVVTPP